MTIAAAKPANAREFVLTRTFKAPRALVFEAWTDPRLMAKWWGPAVFTNPVCEMDVRVGGKYRIVMRSPAGKDFPLQGVYREVVPNERIVFTDNWEEHPDEFIAMLPKNPDGSTAKESINAVTFEDHDGGTLLTIRSLFETAAVREGMEKMQMRKGWLESLVKLESLTETMS